ERPQRLVVVPARPHALATEVGAAGCAEDGVSGSASKRRRDGRCRVARRRRLAALAIDESRERKRPPQRTPIHWIRPREGVDPKRREQFVYNSQQTLGGRAGPELDHQTDRATAL